MHQKFGAIVKSRILSWFTLNFCRNILGVRKSTNLDALYGELGRYPLNIIRKLRLIKYWIILLSKRNSLEWCIVYLVWRKDCDNGNNYNGMNWAWHIKYELDNLGFFRHMDESAVNRHTV